jgi:hypothetical protein
MVRIRMSDLNDAVKAFLAPAQHGETIVVEDDNGTLQCGITPYVQASAKEREAALAALDQLRQKSDKAMSNLGIAESDIDRELQTAPLDALDQRNNAAASASVDLPSRNINEHQAADLRQPLKPFADDWDRPEMDVYDAV